MEKKQTISSKEAVKGLISKFISYSILILFIFFALTIFVMWLVGNNKTAFSNYTLAKYSLTIIDSFILFFFIRLICKLSTFDVLKKHKITKKDTENVLNKMNLFFICLIILSVILILVSLIIKSNVQTAEIKLKSANYYASLPEDFAGELTDKLINEYASERNSTVLQTLIIEFGLILGLLSLIPAQKKLIEKHNT